VIGTLWLAGCGGASVGDACKDGSECGGGLFCLIKKGMPGACAAEPTGCGDAPKCSDTCYDAIKATCAMGAACISINGATTISCQ
jgi:hypothetical protein